MHSSVLIRCLCYFFRKVFKSPLFGLKNLCFYISDCLPKIFVWTPILTLSLCFFFINTHSSDFMAYKLTVTNWIKVKLLYLLFFIKPGWFIFEFYFDRGGFRSGQGFGEESPCVVLGDDKSVKSREQSSPRESNLGQAVQQVAVYEFCSWR